MICNKCGKNNPAEAQNCSSCGEPMPAASNCGGFSDILTYSAEVKADVPASAPAVSHAEREINMEKQSVNTALAKRSIIFSLIAMAVSVVALIGLIMCIVMVANSDSSAARVVPDEESEELHEKDTDKASKKETQKETDTTPSEEGMNGEKDTDRASGAWSDALGSILGDENSETPPEGTREENNH